MAVKNFTDYNNTFNKKHKETKPDDVIRQINLFMNMLYYENEYDYEMKPYRDSHYNKPNSYDKVTIPDIFDKKVSLKTEIFTGSREYKDIKHKLTRPHYLQLKKLYIYFNEEQIETILKSLVNSKLLKKEVTDYVLNINSTILKLYYKFMKTGDLSFLIKNKDFQEKKKILAMIIQDFAERLSDEDLKYLSVAVIANEQKMDEILRLYGVPVEDENDIHAFSVPDPLRAAKPELHYQIVKKYIEEILEEGIAEIKSDFEKKFEADRAKLGEKTIFYDYYEISSDFKFDKDTRKRIAQDEKKVASFFGKENISQVKTNEWPKLYEAENVLNSVSDEFIYKHQLKLDLDKVLAVKKDVSEDFIYEWLDEGKINPKSITVFYPSLINRGFLNVYAQELKNLDVKSINNIKTYLKKQKIDGFVKLFEIINIKNKLPEIFDNELNAHYQKIFTSGSFWTKMVKDISKNEKNKEIRQNKINKVFNYVSNIFQIPQEKLLNTASKVLKNEKNAAPQL